MDDCVGGIIGFVYEIVCGVMYFVGGIVEVLLDWLVFVLVEVYLY